MLCLCEIVYILVFFSGLQLNPEKNKKQNKTYILGYCFNKHLVFTTST